MILSTLQRTLKRAISSVVERCPDKTEVLGSIPRSPTYTNQNAIWHSDWYMWMWMRNRSPERCGGSSRHREGWSPEANGSDREPFDRRVIPRSPTLYSGPLAPTHVVVGGSDLSVGTQRLICPATLTFDIVGGIPRWLLAGR